MSKKKLWVYELQVLKSGVRHEVLVEKDVSELPDGAGFETRAAAKQHRARKPNTQPLWSDYDMPPQHLTVFRKLLKASGFSIQPEPFSSFQNLVKFVKQNFFRRTR